MWIVTSLTSHFKECRLSRGGKNDILYEYNCTLSPWSHWYDILKIKNKILRNSVIFADLCLFITLHNTHKNIILSSHWGRDSNDNDAEMLVRLREASLDLFYKFNIANPWYVTPFTKETKKNKHWVIKPPDRNQQTTVQIKKMLAADWFLVLWIKKKKKKKSSEQAWERLASQ